MKSLEQRQNELRALLNEFKIMEQNRKDHAEESQAYTKKQQLRIDKIRKENEILKSEITNIAKASGRNITVTQQEILRQIHESGDKYAQLIAQERELMSDLEYEIQQSTNKLLEKRKDMGGVNASRENDALIHKQIRILEHRLEKSLSKFNESIAQNKELRAAIDELRKEQIIYENIYLKMEKELQSKKEKMAELIESSNAAYELRDAALLEIAVIEQAERKEKAEFDKQMDEMSSLLENELRLPSYTTSSSSSSTMPAITNGPSNGLGRNSSTPLLKYNKARQSMFSSPATTNSNNGLLMLENGNNPSFEMMASKSTNDIKGGGGIRNLSSSQQAAIQPSQQPINHVQNFEEAFDRIRQATGITDVTELVKTFIKNEQNNYSLFKYVNEQNAEIEKIQEKMSLLQDDERECKEFSHQADGHKQKAGELEKKKLASNDLIEKYELKNLDLQNYLEVSLRYIQNIHNMLTVQERLQQQQLSVKDENNDINKGIFATGENDREYEDDDKNDRQPVVDRNEALLMFTAIENATASVAATSALVPMPASSLTTATSDSDVSEVNFTEYLGKIEDKLILCMSKYNTYKEQLRMVTNSGSLGSLESTVSGVFPDDDIPDNLRNPPSPSPYTSNRSPVDSSYRKAASTSASTSGTDNSVDFTARQSGSDDWLHVKAPSKLIHPTELNIETGEDHATQQYHGTAVNDDRPMNKVEITKTAVNTIRQHRNSVSKPRKNSVSNIGTNKT